MNGELATVRGTVDLSPQQALDSAENFLTQHGYVAVERTDTTLSVERRQPEEPRIQDAPNLIVEALPQERGGVQIKVRGNDREGVQAQQAAWTEWSESLPKKSEAPTDQPGEQQGNIETPDVPLSPPPTVESSNLPPAPQPPPSYAPPPSTPRSGMGRGTKFAIGGCIALVVLGLLLVLGVGGCAAILASMGGNTGSNSGASKVQESTIGIGQPVTVGDVQWTVTNAQQEKQIKQQGLGQAGQTKRGNFVVVDFDFTNKSDKAMTLDRQSLALIDSSGNKSNPDTDTAGYIPNDKDIFLEQVNPGVTKQGEVIFTVAPSASGFRLQLGDASAFSNKNGYVDLNF